MWSVKVSFELYELWQSEGKYSAAAVVTRICHSNPKLPETQETDIAWVQQPSLIPEYNQRILYKVLVFMTNCRSDAIRKLSLKSLTPH